MSSFTVNRSQGPAYEYSPGDEFRSNILADPGLQYPKDLLVDNIADEVEQVVEIKKDNFDFKKDKLMALFMLTATIALGVLGLIAMLASSFGIGAGALAIGAFTLGVSLLTYLKGREKENSMDKVKAVFGDANRQRIGRTIDNNQKDVENGIEFTRPRGLGRSGSRGFGRLQPSAPYIPNRIQGRGW